MFIYVGASATIRKNNEMNDIKVTIEKMTESNGYLILDLKLEEEYDNESENENEYTVKINIEDGEIQNKSDDDADRNKITTFTPSDIIAKNKYVKISENKNSDNEGIDPTSSVVAKVTGINYGERTVSFLINEGGTTSFDIGFNELNRVSIKSETVPEESIKKKKVKGTTKKAEKQRRKEDVSVEEADNDDDDDAYYDAEDDDNVNESPNQADDEEDNEDEEIEVEVEVLNPDVFTTSPKDQLVKSMEDKLSSNLRENPRNSIRIYNECDSLFALYDVIEDDLSLSPRQMKYKKRRIDQFLQDGSPNVPSWILPISHNKKKIYDVSDKMTTAVLIKGAENVLQSEEDANRRAIDVKYGGDYVSNLEEFTRPFTEAITSNSNAERKKFPKYTLTEAIISVGPVLSFNIQDTKKNIIQMFIPTDKILLKKNQNNMCLIEDLRRYSRVFVPTTSIYDKVYETSDRSLVSGVRQRLLQGDDKDNENKRKKTKLLPTLKENISYVVSHVEEKDKSSMNLLVNATSLVEQLNFSNVYWHDIDRKEWWETKKLIKDTQKTLKLYIKDSIQNYIKNNKSNTKNNTNTISLKIFGESIFYDAAKGCKRIINEMIKAYNLPKKYICEAEALNKMMNIDYGDAYYKYLNYCNSNIEMLGGNLNIGDYYEEQSRLLCGKHSINNMLNKVAVISDFDNMEDYIDGKLNLAHVCVECEVKANANLCVPDKGYGDFDAGVIMKAIDLLGYDMVIFPESHRLEIEKCNYFPNEDAYYNITKDLGAAADNMLSVTYVGSILYLRGHYTALRLSSDKQSVEYIDSLKVTDSKIIARNTNQLYRLLKNTLGNSPDMMDKIYTIINVHHKMVRSMAIPSQAQADKVILEIPIQYDNAVVEVVEVVPERPAQRFGIIVENEGESEDEMENQLSVNNDVFGVESQEDRGNEVNSDRDDNVMGEGKKDSSEAEEDEDIANSISDNSTKEIEERDDNDMGEGKKESSEEEVEDITSSSDNSTKVIEEREDGGNDEDDDEEDNENLQKYVDMIKKSIGEYDNYTCHKYKVANENEMIQSISMISRLRDMENNRIMKYQIENYVKVESLDVNNEMVSRLLGTTSQNFYRELIMNALSDRTSCWSYIVEIKRSLGNNFVIVTSKKEGGDEDNNIDQVWLETIYKESSVKVMPYYFIELSNFFVYGEGSIKEIIVKLINNKNISKEDRGYACQYLDGFLLPIPLELDNSDTSYNSNTLPNTETNNIRETVSQLSNINRKEIKFFIDFSRKVINYFASSNEVTLQGNQMIHKFLPIFIKSFEEAKADKGMDTATILHILCGAILIIGLQSSPYFCKKRTVKFEDKEKILVLGVNAICGYPAETIHGGDSHQTNTLLNYVSKRLSEALGGDSQRIHTLIVGYIKNILAKNKNISEEIKKNVKTLTEDIPGNDWYENQWSNFAPPLFPVGAVDENVLVQNDVCRVNNEYKEKFVLLKLISNLSIKIMKVKNENANSSYENTKDKQAITTYKNLTRNYEKLTRLCYNVPATANYLVSSTKTRLDIIEEVKVFNFSDNFRKRFIEFYCSKGPQSVVDLCKTEADYNIAITNEKSNEEWFLRVLKSVNEKSMITDFVKATGKSDTQSPTEPDPVNRDVCPNPEDENKNDSIKDFNKNNKIETIGFNYFITNLKILTDAGVNNGSTTNNIQIKKSQFKLWLSGCVYKDVIEKTNRALTFADVNQRSIYNFIKVNVKQLVNITSLKECKSEEMKVWHTCWKANLKYYRYNHDVFDEIIQNTKDHDHVMLKMNFVLKYIMCMAVASCKDKEIGDVNKILIKCLDKIIENKKCMNMSSTELRTVLTNQSTAERNKQVNLDKYDSELRKRLKKAGIHREQNIKFNRDHGIMD